MPLPTCSKCRFKGVGHSDASGKFCCEWCWAGLEGRRWPTLGGHSPQFKALTAALRPSSFSEDDRENKVALVDVGMEADAECAELERTGALNGRLVLGFDTETKPVFRKGQAPNTVCLVQLATRSLVVLFRLSRLAGAALPASLRALLEDPAILLVGVGCSGDEASLRKRCPDLDCGGTLFDLEKLAKSKYPSLRACGLRGLVGSCAKMRLSKAQNTANWELAEYTPAMAKYAANDAAAGLFILDVLLAP